MTSIREPSSTQYKQVLYPWIKWPKKYTSCKMPHDDYMETEVWKGLAKQRLKMDGMKCTSCGSGENVQVHHLRYPEVWGEERLDDLRTLCDSCHKEIHKVDIERRNNL